MGSGGYVSQYSYLPFGGSLSSTVSVSNPFQFIGQSGVIEDAVAQYQMRAREYDSTVGRFDSQDPHRTEGKLVKYRGVFRQQSDRL